MDTTITNQKIILIGWKYLKPTSHSGMPGNSLFVVPNVAAIIEAADSETVRSDASGIDLTSITEIPQLKEFGVDVDALNAELQKILQRGVEPEIFTGW